MVNHNNPEQKRIVGVHKLHGNIQQVKLNTGEVIDVEQAIQMAEQNLIGGVNTGATRGDHPHKTLRSNPDGDPNNNLDNLPEF